MHPKKSIINKIVTIVLLSGWLAGCASGGGSAVRYYLVNPAGFSALQDAPRNKLAIEIMDLHVPQYLEHLQIAVRTGENGLRFSDANQWGENLRKNLMQTMAQNLASLLSTADISTPLNRSSSMPDIRLEIHIDRFEKDSDGLVKLAARWQLIDAAGSRPLGIHSADLQSHERIPEGDYDRMVSAMRVMYGQLCRKVAESILQETGGKH